MNKPVRICDTCELKETRGVSDEIDVTDQMSASLKESLKEKAKELELFKALLAHTSSSDISSLLASTHTLCADLQTLTNEYSNLRMDSSELERNIRSVAQKCLHAESIVKDGYVLTSDIEKLSRQVGVQDRQIIQLQERLDRLTNPPLTSSPARTVHSRSPSPPPQMTVIASADRRPTVKSVLKELVRI
jgi:chromosome segregation ATPase